MDKAITKALEHIKHLVDKLDTKGDFNAKFGRAFPLSYNYNRETGLRLETPEKTWEVEELIIATMNNLVHLRQSDGAFTATRLNSEGELEEKTIDERSFIRTPTKGSVDLEGDGKVTHEKSVIECQGGSKFDIDIPFTNLRIVDISFSSSTGKICWVWVTHKDFKGRRNNTPSTATVEEQKEIDNILDGK